MTLEFVDTLWIILIISISTMILSPLLCWIISHKPLLKT